MLEIKKYLKEWGRVREWKRTAFSYFDKMKKFCKRLQALQFLSLFLTAFQLVLKFLYLSNELMSVCLLNYDSRNFPSIHLQYSVQCLNIMGQTQKEHVLLFFVVVFFVFWLKHKSTLTPLYTLIYLYAHIHYFLTCINPFFTSTIFSSHDMMHVCVIKILSQKLSSSEGLIFELIHHGYSLHWWRYLEWYGE